MELEILKNIYNLLFINTTLLFSTTIGLGMYFRIKNWDKRIDEFMKKYDHVIKSYESHIVDAEQSISHSEAELYHKIQTSDNPTE